MTSASPDRRAGRIRMIPPTVFAEFSALAARTGAINLGQGFPDTDGPSSVIERAADALRGTATTPSSNQYAPGAGTIGLRRAVAEHQRRHYGIALDPETEVVITTGCTEGIAASLLGLVDPGDEVIVLEPYYDSYVAMLEMCSAVRVPVPLRAPDFRLDVAQLRAAISPRATAILLNTPHNPTGSVLSAEELRAVADLAIAHDLVVISDEVYEHLVFDTAQHIPIATLPGMFERTVTLSSVGKSWSLTGWKVGWASGPEDLVAAVTGAKQWLTYTSGAPFQPAVQYALDHEPDWPHAMAAQLQARRDLLCDGLREAGLDPYRPQGTYFTLTDVSRLGWVDGRDFCLALPQRAGVVAIPAQGFYDSDAGRHLVRWAFCKQPDVLREATARLAEADLGA